MLSLGSSRGARGQPQNRSRGRGRGSTNRGALNSFSKLDTDSHTPVGPRVLQASASKTSSRGRGFRNTRSIIKCTDPSPAVETSNSFDKERLENAAKREQRGQNGAMINGTFGAGGGRGQGKGIRGNKQVRFAEPSSERVDSKENVDSQQRDSSDSKNITPGFSTFGSPAVTSGGIFAPKSDGPKNPFATTNTFGGPSQAFNSVPATTFGQATAAINGNGPANPFGAPSQPSTKPFTSSPFGMPSNSPSANLSTSAFGLQSTTSTASPPSNPFAANSSAASKNPFGASNNTSSQSTSNPFGTLNQVTSTTNSFSNGFVASTSFNSLASKASSTSSSSAFPKVGANEKSKNGQTHGSSLGPQHPTNGQNTENSALAKEIYQVIQRERLVAPTWPKISPARQNEYNAAIDTYWRASRDYRSKVRQSLIRAGLLDDPEKAKKLSEAIDFKGICQEMCPIFERATRINESDVKQAEMSPGADGNLYVSPEKMVKANARSAAGQDAPLPMDVRSPATLRKTLDYIFNEVLGDNLENLYNVHNFLWDRTRAIRRDFVFQSSMDPSEMSHQTYCLERIVRFHAISLHQMSKNGIITPSGEDFSEQQEVEQLSKALLSLMHCYDDCNKQKVQCENEPEFRAYYVLFNCRHPGVLQNVQAWGYGLYNNSDEIQTAVAIVESLQNIWHANGPLTPHSATDVAQNAFAKFFTVVGDRTVSYTMACFAEMHFNSARKFILKTILASYRKQRDQTRDWTLTKLNVLLRFDNEEDIVTFGEAYGLRFEEVDGEIVLSFDSDDLRDPFPPLKQAYSFSLVERKRGSHSLPEAIALNVYDDTVVDEVEIESNEDDESLFVPDNTAKPSLITHTGTKNFENKNFGQDSVDDTKPASQQSSIFGMDSQSMKPGSFNNPPGPVQKSPFAGLFSTPTPPQPSHSPTISSQQPEPPRIPASQVQQSKPDSTSIFSNLGSSPFKPSTPAATGSQTPPIPNNSWSTSTSKPQSSLFQPAQPLDTPLSNVSQLPATTTSKQSGQLNFSGISTTPTPPISEISSERLQSDAKQPQSLPSQSLQPGDLTTGPVAAPTSNHTASGILEANNVASQDVTPRSSSGPAKRPRGYDRESQLKSLTNWTCLGEEGLLDHFISFTVEGILRDTANQFIKDQTARIEKETAKSMRQEADAYRYRSIATKYFHLWRNGAQRLRLKRRGREARKARQERAENLRASKAAQSTDVVADFKALADVHGASRELRRRGSLASLLDATGVLDGVHDPSQQIQDIVHRDSSTTSSKRPRFDGPTDSQASSTSSNRHKRGKSDNPLRRSLLSDPSYLAGGSRIHLMSDYGHDEQERRHISGVQTDYFRLKARGISTLPDGTPLASSVAKSITHRKRSFNGISKHPVTPLHSKHSSISRSVPPKTSAGFNRPRSSVERDDDIQRLKLRAQAVLAGNDRQQPKRSHEVDDNEDHALFERAKRIREQMDEGSMWYKSEIARQSGSRSVS
ncbi:leucine permease transcriptional regulator [Glarea lozoyensis ATCC 20868]|uniref:Leucine permease transcriptional regulator n=1 Tax=Glarea lozoyensis (strain ATCC 20868 / MF5171) TaxID=1116229 RepID=S3CVQ4_GLAL2|nr:leucine permease transcriptional regulator [Glarea lozoyensis ATCC 20868]EPE29720.1 leucine permease transcriptional regulator [Glarea lozoyensis ATCC 20868]